MVFQLKYHKVMITIFGRTFPDTRGDLYSRPHLQNTPIVAPSCGKRGSVD
jgi:hypothetical protein